MIKNLFLLLSKKEKIYFFLFLSIFIFFSILDIIGLYFFSIGISGLLDPNNFNDLIKNSFIFSFFQLDNLKNIKISKFYLLLLIFFVSKNIFFYFFYFFQARFIANISSRISSALYKYFLSASYRHYSQYNFAENSKNITHDVSKSVQLISTINTFIKELSLIFLIISFIFFLNVNFFLLIFAILLLTFSLFKILYSDRLKFYGNQNQEYTTRQLKRVLDSFNLFVEIKILNLLNFFFDKFRNESFVKEYSEQRSNIIINIPRLVIEVFIIFLLFLIVTLFEIKNLNQEIFYYSFLLILILRLIPATISLNRVVFDIKFCNVSLKILLNKLILYSKNVEHKKKSILNFKKNIIFKNVSFNFVNHVNVLKKINLKIIKNDTIGIIGSTGSGKTTLVLMLIGLLRPTSGKILVDNIDINKKYSLRDIISYAPQDTTLINDTVIRNITFKDELSNVELKRLNHVIAISESKNFLNRNFLNKTVKEKGINFSGGQRKRIGLTRSLFVEKDIYIFDEPTNSLDLSTAKKFIKNIKKFLFNKTVIIITHDKNILKYCNKVFVLKNKKLYLVKKN